MGGRMRRATAGWLVLIGIAAALGASFSAFPAASAQRLRSPWDGETVTPTDAPYTCPAPPAFAPTLPPISGFYTDKQYSIIDPKAQAAYEQINAAPTHLWQYAAAAADAWRFTGSREAARCAYSLLAAAAQADAWDGKMPDNNGVYTQNWLLSGTALAYLKVRDGGVGTPAEEKAIQQWFDKLAGRVGEYFEMSASRPGSDAWNNHVYWAGLAIAADGVANNDQDAFLWGLATYRRGIDAIQPDGSLTAEMGRGQRALHYQIYALDALIIIAELGEANGINLYAERDGAIHRLVAFNMAGMKDPSPIAARTGIKQVGVGENGGPPYSGLDIGWAVPWVARFPDSQLSAWIAQAPWVNLSSWGGAPPDGKSSPGPASGPQAEFEAALRHKVQAAFDAQFPATRAKIAGFFGQWCAYGNPAWKSSIVDCGNLVALTTQTGDTSTGEAKAANVLIARAWGPVVGTLTPNGSQIDWTNGTYWAKCDAPAAASRTHLAGTWYANGLPLASTIRQHGDNLELDNGQGGTGTGSVDFSWTPDHGLERPAHHRRCDRRRQPHQLGQPHLLDARLGLRKTEYWFSSRSWQFQMTIEVRTDDQFPKLKRRPLSVPDSRRTSAGRLIMGTPSPGAELRDGC